MPFSHGPYGFNMDMIEVLAATGGIFGLAHRNTPAGDWVILRMGKTDNLRERLTQYFRDPPVPGITHFFADGVANELARTQREFALVKECRAGVSPAPIQPTRL